MFYDGGRRVAGVGPIMGEGQPTYWSTYFATDDVDALTARVKDAGGNVLVEPMDVMDAGRMAIYVHPAGGMFGAWQAGSAHRRAAGQRAGLARLELADDARPRRRDVVPGGDLRRHARRVAGLRRRARTRS